MKAMTIMSAASRIAPGRLRRGISLIEALVAMAVMAFGMLGVLGLQATLRASADLSKQRSEATRLAQERIEAWRSFSVLTTTAGTKAYQDVTTPVAETLTSFVSNTTYTRTATVTETASASGQDAHKALKVDVSWNDRAGTLQNVQLFSAMAKISPELAATMVAPPQGAGGVREPGGRARGIPPQAKNFGDGTSGFRPPQGAGTVAWVFNNTTGLITSVCTTSAVDNATLTLASLSACNTTQKFQLISGYIRFALAAAQPTTLQVADPTDAPAPATIEAEVAQTVPTTLVATRACFHGIAATYVEFFCAIPVLTVAAAPDPALTWAGTLQIRPATLPTLSATLADTVATNRKVCRYRAAATYAAINTPLANENLVVIRAGNGTALTCPTPTTWPHQPAT